MRATSRPVVFHLTDHQELHRRDIVQTANHFPLGATIAFTATQDPADLVGGVGAVQAPIDRREVSKISEKGRQGVKRTYPTDVQQLFSLRHSNRNEIRGFLRDSSSTCEVRGVKIKLVTLNGCLLALKLRRGLLNKRKLVEVTYGPANPVYQHVLLTITEE